MAKGSGTWKWVGAIGLLSACGGNAFVLADAAPQGDAVKDSGPDEAEAPPMASGVFCGLATTCDTRPVCCTGVSTGTSCAENAGQCGCVTRLACANDTTCPAAQPICCIRSATDPSCGSPVFQATCNLACADGTRVCDPSAPGCPGAKTCLTDQSSLEAVGLPVGQGFGVCGN